MMFLFSFTGLHSFSFSGIKYMDENVMIQDLLNTINHKDVKAIRFDMTNAKIEIDLQDNSTVSFNDVVSFYYTDDDVHGLIKTIELKPIVYEAAGFETLFSHDDYQEEEAFSVPNFSVTLPDRSVLIEAKSINIRGNSYHLNKISN